MLFFCLIYYVVLLALYAQMLGDATFADVVIICDDKYDLQI